MKTANKILWLTLPLLLPACNLVLGLNGYTDRCPNGQVVEDFRECPDGGPSSSAASTGAGGGTGECKVGAKRACYTGTHATRNVGECHDGVQTCGHDDTWGACEGDQLPTAENYDKKGDENCDSFASGDTDWAEMFQTPEYLTGNGTDAQGNIYIFGAYAQHDLKFGTTNLQNVGNSSNVFLAKLSPTGKPIWAKRLAVLTGPYDGPQTMAVSPTGAIVLSITSSSPIDLGNGNAATGLIIAGYSTDGDLSWSRTCSGSSASLGQMAFDSTGAIVGIGSYSGTTDCGLGAMPTPGSGDSDILLVKFSSHGAPLKAAHFGDFRNQYGSALTVDKDDNVIITGTASGAFSFGVFPAVGDGDGDGDAFVAAFSSSFNNLWTATWTDPQLQSPSFISLDPDGSIFFGGAFLGTIPFGASAGTLQAQGMTLNMFVASLSDAGVPIWAQSYPGGPTMVSDGIRAGITDSKGQHVVMGRFQGTLDLGGQMHTASGEADSFIGVLDSKGKTVWSKSYGGASTTHTYFYNLALNPQGDGVITGVFDGTVDFGTGPLVPKDLLTALLVMQVEP